MRTPIALGLAALLAACATPAERAAQMEREAEQMMQIYGPACEKLGYKSDSDLWRDCILRLSAQDTFERYGRSPSTMTCFGHRGFFQCSTF